MHRLNSGLKAIVFNKIGDCIFLLTLGIVFMDFNYSSIFNSNSGSIDEPIILVMMILMFLGDNLVFNNLTSRNHDINENSLNNLLNITNHDIIHDLLNDNITRFNYSNSWDYDSNSQTIS